VPLVVVERDRSLGDIEGEVAIGAIAIFPAAVGLAEEIIGQRFDGDADRLSLAFDIGCAADMARNLDLTRWQRDNLVTSPGFNFFELPAP